LSRQEKGSAGTPLAAKGQSHSAEDCFAGAAHRAAWPGLSDERGYLKDAGGVIGHSGDCRSSPVAAIDLVRF